jgi:hypothetical protein
MQVYTEEMELISIGVNRLYDVDELTQDSIETLLAIFRKQLIKSMKEQHLD